jgi:hypothetical protein
MAIDSIKYQPIKIIIKAKVSHLMVPLFLQEEEIYID